MAEETLGKFLERARRHKGFTSAEKVQDASGKRIAANTIRQIEKGHVGRPAPETLEVLAEVYELDSADLFRRAGYPDGDMQGPPREMTADDWELVRIRGGLRRPEIRDKLLKFAQELEDLDRLLG